MWCLVGVILNDNIVCREQWALSVVKGVPATRVVQHDGLCRPTENCCVPLGKT